ncbi:MAG: hypothetical protein ACK5OB_18240, partial [Pirellula sp.]
RICEGLGRVRSDDSWNPKRLRPKKPTRRVRSTPRMSLEDGLCYPEDCPIQPRLAWPSNAS